MREDFVVQAKQRRKAAEAADDKRTAKKAKALAKAIVDEQEAREAKRTKKSAGK